MTTLMLCMSIIDCISLTICPSASLAGSHCLVTNTESLRRILRHTDLPLSVLEKFESGIYNPKGANLPAVGQGNQRYG